VAASEPGTEQVYVIFEGPWAIVSDPEDANKVIAIAPKTNSHRPLAFVPASKILDAGVYELTMPTHGESPKTFDLGDDFLRINPDREQVLAALGNKSGRYAIRLPRPEEIVAETRHPSRVDTQYPPQTGFKNYASSVSLVYHVTTRTGFHLAGTPDVGATLELPPPILETPMIRFVIDPAEITMDTCDLHSRRAFHDLTTLLGLKLFVDFRNDDDCHKRDPQVSDSKRAALINRLLAGWSPNSPEPQFAGTGAFITSRWMEATVYGLADRLGVAFYFFHSAICHTPMPVGP
jgi:hypothetical protein